MALRDYIYYEEPAGVIYCGDCLEIMPLLEPNSVDLVVTDPPYGLTENPWDKKVDLTTLWFAINRLSGIAIFTASQPFSSQLIISNLPLFKHEWIWWKNRGSNFANTVREPMKEHEHILCFASTAWIYNPQYQTRSSSGSERVQYKFKAKTKSANYREFERGPNENMPENRIPSSVQRFNVEVGLHPTQKPILLMAYILNTYSNPKQLILDPFLGSGTTAVAAKQLGRRFIGIEIEERYCKIAKRRLAQEELF